MILIPKHRDLIVPVVAQTRVAGFYKLEAVDAMGRRRLLADWFPNLITTNGANAFGSATVLGTCAVGSGNATPALTDTALQALVASTTTTNSTTQSNSGSSPYFGSYTVQYNFAIGVATGNLSEVGVGPTATSLFSRALILDGGGSPTTITVLSSEALYVTYQLNQYVPLSDVTGSVTIAGVSYGYTVRAGDATSTEWAYSNANVFVGIVSAVAFNGTIGAITTTPSGTASSASSIANNSYSSGSFSRSGTATWNLISGNLSGGITAALVRWGDAGNSNNRGLYQIGFSPAIPKDASHVLTLSFSTSWAINTP